MYAQNPRLAGIPVLFTGISGDQGMDERSSFFYPFDAPHVHFEHAFIPLFFSAIPAWPVKCTVFSI